jgi:carbonic anhydrase
VMAALTDLRVGLADNWIRHVQDVRNRHQSWLDTLPADQRVDALGELNVIEQARNVCQTTVVQDAWSRGQSLVVHGWFYGLHDGRLQDLKITVAAADQMATAFDAAVTALHARRAPTVEGGGAIAAAVPSPAPSTASSPAPTPAPTPAGTLPPMAGVVPRAATGSP